jgi:SAM-dependent methyltransferase
VGQFFGELYLRSTLPYLTAARTRQEAEFIRLALELGPEHRVLDVCSGHGRHVVALQQFGVRAIGLEKDAASLEETAVTVRDRCVRGDLYAMPFGPVFDAVYSWYASLFLSADDEVNLSALREAARVLKPGGGLLVHSHNPIREAREADSEFVSTLWDGARLTETTRYDLRQNVLRGHRVLTHGDQRLEGDFLVRCPSLKDHQRWADALGMELENHWGDALASEYKPGSPDLIVCYRKPASASGLLRDPALQTLPSVAASPVEPGTASAEPRGSADLEVGKRR